MDGFGPDVSEAPKDGADRVPGKVKPAVLEPASRGMTRRGIGAMSGGVEPESKPVDNKDSDDDKKAEGVAS